MTSDESASESLEDFAGSLSYGKRSDLSFKFLTRLDARAVGDALAEILIEVGGVYDTGDPADLIDAAIRLQADGYRSRPLNQRYHHDDGPFVVPSRPVAESRVALFTSSGHFVDGDDPNPLGVESMTQGEAEERISDFLRAEPSLSEIPVSTSAASLRVRHGGYDVRGALADHNVAFPIDRLRELEATGVIGTLHESAYSFVGACSQMRLSTQTAPKWAERIASAGIDVVLLVPV